MPPCEQRLSRLWLLLIIKRKKRPHPRFWHHAPGRCQSISGNAVAESENIVDETAEQIFRDLADAQTINRDNKGEWKAPLGQALTEAGLPLAWVPEDCGGSGASMGGGVSVVRAGRRFGIAVPLAA